MKANLTYSIISAELKQGMYLLVNNHLGYISRMNNENAIISFYYEDGKVIKLGKQEMTRENAISTYSTSVIKLIAIVDGNPVSINHQNYKKIFSPMLTFPKDGEDSYISQFIATKEWIYPIYGDISPVYSMLKISDVVSIKSLPIVDAYSLYDPIKRLVKVKSKKGNSKYIVTRMDNEVDDGFEITVDRADVVLGEKDKYDLFNMNFDLLKNLIANGEAKTVEAKGRVQKEPTGNAFYHIHKSKWHATYDKLPGNDHYQWLAVREADGDEANLIVPISIPLTNIPKHQFSGFDNDYWIPGTIREMNKAEADGKNFVPFREGLPIFGKLTETIIGGKTFTYFLLDNVKQESINHYIFKHRDITEERRSELTIKKLPTLE